MINHKRNRKTLQHHLQLLELLELPQLVDACTRNGFMDEAIELANFVNGLERRHLLAAEVKSDIAHTNCNESVMESIVNDVHASLKDLRHALLMQLTETNPLPKLIQIVATLRKIDGLFIDRQLNLQRYDKNSYPCGEEERSIIRGSYIDFAIIKQQMDFLEARSVWMENLLLDVQHSSRQGEAAFSTTGSYGKTIEIIEVRRTALFSIISQFNALFDHVDTSPSSAISHSLDIDRDVVQLFSTRVIIQSWINRQMSVVIRDLESILPSFDDAASVRSIFEQCHFLSMRLGHEGCDFTHSITNLFENYLESKFLKDLQSALKSFKSILITEKIVLEGLDKKEQIIPLYNAHEWDTDVSQNMLDSGDREIPYPQYILKFPPLAYLLNSILTLFNFLRECPLITIRESCLKMLFKFFSEMRDFIIENFSDIRHRGSKYFGDGFMTNLGTTGIKMYGATTHIATNRATNEKYDMLLVEAFTLDFIPHLILSLECMFGTIQFPTIMALHSKLPTTSKVEHIHLMSFVGKGIFSASIALSLHRLLQPFLEAKLIEAEVDV